MLYLFHGKTLFTPAGWMSCVLETDFYIVKDLSKLLGNKNSDKLFWEESIVDVKVTEKLVNKAHDVNV